MITQKPTSLAELLAWQAMHTRGPLETVGQFLKRRLVSHANSLVEDPHVRPQDIVATCEMTGDDAVGLIFDQMDAALTWDEPFRSHFLEDAQEWFVGTDIDELVAQFERHRGLTQAQKSLIEAALDGRVTLSDDGQVAVVRHTPAVQAQCDLS
ncbi:hypothetical protein [Brevundimonas sp. R86498]|uniref:hypothetical protein n=1 Tax=Brevundimonas sp. R86498 TaxID=3093845 RepID=UPI0037C5A80C